MSNNRSALLLSGFQNDYFASQGILSSVIDEHSKARNIVQKTVSILRALPELTIISSPMAFSHNYEELSGSIGILKAIQDAGALKRGTWGAMAISELDEFKDRIIELPGKQGLNAFVNTGLDDLLKQHNIKEVMLAGVVCSLCIDSTGRSAYDKGYKVTMVADCISGRTLAELDFYCENIFPLYSDVVDSIALRNDSLAPVL